MNYHNITKDDMLNGDGIRTVLWLSGCSHHCPGCQNPLTWDPDGGLPFDNKARQELWSYLDQDYCTGLTLSGGDPLYFDNWTDVLELVKEFRKRYGNSKDLWLYTGYLFDQVKHNPILNYVDVILDGPFIEAEKNVQRKWVGSDNQIIYRKIKGEWRRMAKEYSKSLNDFNQEEKCACDC